MMTQATLTRSDREIAGIVGMAAGLAFALLTATGCAHIPNQFRETGPSYFADWNTATANDVYARFEPSEPITRDWEPLPKETIRGGVTHWPVYFEDPFVDKGAGRDQYRLGWEDYVALAYSYPRFTLNWLALPVSMVVTPPWTVMVSDGVLSRQALGYDHDAERWNGPADQGGLMDFSPSGPSVAPAPPPPIEPLAEEMPA